MTTVQRTSGDQILTNHEQRITALERSPGRQIYVDSRVLDAATDNVLFESFPQDRTILELSWLASLDSGAVADPCFAGLLFNGDAVNNTPFFDDDEYRWNVGIPNDAVDPLGTFVSIDEAAYFNDYGVVSWITTGEASWGRIRFPAYNLVPDDSFYGRSWNGDCAVGSGGNDDSNPGVCSGGKEDYMGAALTALSMIASKTDDVTARQQFAAGSWFALTAY